ncbi:hypothetical protein D3C81_1594970 [compost metagenome]
MFCACSTGTLTTSLMPAARCRNGSGGKLMLGITLARVLWVSQPEPITPKKSSMPVAS